MNTWNQDHVRTPGNILSKQKLNTYHQQEQLNKQTDQLCFLFLCQWAAGGVFVSLFCLAYILNRRQTSCQVQTGANYYSYLGDSTWKGNQVWGTRSWALMRNQGASKYHQDGCLYLSWDTQRKCVASQRCCLLDLGRDWCCCTSVSLHLEANNRKHWQL